MITFFSPKTQFENVGDALINRELIRLASDNSSVVLDVSRCPLDFVEDLSVNFDNVDLRSDSFLQFFLSIIYFRVFRSEDVVYLLSPGGYFGDLDFFGRFKQALNNASLAFLNLIGVKVVLFGASYERMGSRYISVIRARARYLYRHYVRDHQSREYLSEMKVRCDGVAPDLAFNLVGRESELSTAKRYIFSFRVDQDIQQEERATFLVNCLLRNIPQGTTVVFYSQVRRDDAGMERIASLVEAEFESSLQLSIKSSHSVAEAEVAFSEGDVVISNRLHVLLVAASQGARIRPCVYKGFNQKIKGIFADVGYSSDLIDMDRFDSSDISGACNSSFSYEQFSNCRQELKRVFSSIYGGGKII